MAGKYQPAFLAGLVLGVLSSLPIVSAANCCCGLWFVTAGALAAWLMQQNQPFPIALGDGALAGLLAGVVGAAVWGILYLPIHSVTGVWQRRLAERVLDSTAELPPHLRDLIETSQGAGGLVFGLVFGLMFMLVVGGAFATLGGLLGALLFRKDAPPPPFGPPGPTLPPFVPPPPPPPVVPPAPPQP
ncbi:MAG TPA: hypothetical protein VHH91_05200 [Vicinamibacterales bacterium]|nr:hypothetical protein [Vicinamibacterales bacterium]